MDISPLLAHFLSLAAAYRYPLLMVGAIIEGPIIMVSAGFLLHFKIFDPVLMTLSLIVGDLIGDVFWYAAGYYLAEPLLRRHGHFFSLTTERVEKIKTLFTRYHESILFISKITLGLGLAVGTLVVAGITRVKFSRYLVINLIGEIVLVAVLLTTGYFFGGVYAYVADSLKVVFIFTLLLTLVLLLYGLSQYVKSRVQQL